MNLRLPLALAALVVTAGCAGAGSSGSGSGSGGGAASTGASTPGDATTSWDATAPAEPVDEADVRADYDGLLDAATGAVDAQAPGLTWSGSVLRTEDFEGVCAVTLERTADGPVPPPGDDTLDLGGVDAATGDAGFDGLVMADDPGGALRYLAHGDAGALLELRSKDVTTLAVRVPTTTDSCDG